MEAADADMSSQQGRSAQNKEGDAWRPRSCRHNYQWHAQKGSPVAANQGAPSNAALSHPTGPTTPPPKCPDLGDSSPHLKISCSSHVSALSGAVGYSHLSWPAMEPSRYAMSPAVTAPATQAGGGDLVLVACS